MELSPQELRPRFPHLPSVWKPSWVDPEVCADVLQAVLPQQCQGDWLHQVPLNGETTSFRLAIKSSEVWSSGLFSLLVFLFIILSKTIM
ncbi:hypothetical protein C1H46_003659 [Malus baccata]|uniref:Uncharacterized protein n=1 Tax=Malus baccata TaxID=106549 RepID=A0A540NI89_MALBA|nr:hypothetical protein C1H46_003659 [Malus baccata]